MVATKISQVVVENSFVSFHKFYRKFSIKTTIQVYAMSFIFKNTGIWDHLLHFDKKLKMEEAIMLKK